MVLDGGEQGGTRGDGRGRQAATGSDGSNGARVAARSAARKWSGGEGRGRQAANSVKVFTKGRVGRARICLAKEVCGFKYQQGLAGDAADLPSTQIGQAASMPSFDCDSHGFKFKSQAEVGVIKNRWPFHS